MLDIEANGLHGQLLCFAALFFAEGEQIYEWTARVPAIGTVDPWVLENVYPVIGHIEYTHETIDGVYAEWRKLCEQWTEPLIVAHVPWPIESRFLWEAHKDIPYSGPFPLVDTASMLIGAGRVPDFEQFLRDEGILLPVGKRHDPTYDARVTAMAYFELMRQSQVKASR